LEQSEIFSQVIADLQDRDQLGWKNYRRELTADTYDDPLKEAYEEALDLAVYLKCAILQRQNDET